MTLRRGEGQGSSFLKTLPFWGGFLRKAGGFGEFYLYHTIIPSILFYPVKKK
jgi:hypothetical protein